MVARDTDGVIRTGREAQVIGYTRGRIRGPRALSSDTIGRLRSQNSNTGSRRLYH